MRLFFALIFTGIAAVLVTGQEECPASEDNPSETITSPNYPNDHPHNLYLNWTITAPEGYEIWVDFVFWSVETNVDCHLGENAPRTNCFYDFIVVHDNTTSHGPFCGSGSHLCYYFYSNEVYLRFQTDSMATCQGFEVEFFFVPINQVKCTVTGMEITISDEDVPQGGVFVENYTASSEGCPFTLTDGDHFSAINYGDCGMAGPWAGEDGDHYWLRVMTWPWFPFSSDTDEYYYINCTVPTGVEATIGVIDVTNVGDDYIDTVEGDINPTAVVEIWNEAESQTVEVADVGQILKLIVIVLPENGYPGGSDIEFVKAYPCNPNVAGCNEIDAYPIWMMPSCDLDRAGVVQGDMTTSGLEFTIPIFAFTLMYQAVDTSSIWFQFQLLLCLTSDCYVDCPVGRRRREAGEEDWTVVSGDRQRRQARSPINSTTVTKNLIVSRDAAVETVTIEEDISIEKCLSGSGLQVILACMASLIIALLITLVVFALVYRRRREGKGEEVDNDGKRDGKKEGRSEERRGHSPHGSGYTGPYQLHGEHECRF